MLRAILCACLVLAGCASTKQSEISGPIHVTCEGRTLEQAKSNCFSQAIEFAVGAVVVTETEVRSRNLVKDDILKHSSGYVDDYKILNQVDGNNRVVLSMDVRVKQSKIAERIISIQTATGEIQGQRLNDQYKSFIQQKNSGDSLLRSVLNDYPKYAFNVEKGEVQYRADIQRNPVIVVPYKITWNYKYLTALNEVLAATQDEKSRTMQQETILVSSKDPKAWLIGKTDVYHYNDLSRSNMIKRTFVNPLYVHLKFKDDNGRVLIAGCDEGTYLAGPNITDPFRINGNEVIEEEIHVTVRTNQYKLKLITEVEVSVSEKQCTFIE